MRIQPFLLLLAMTACAFAQTPSIADGGVLNGASFARGQAITVGSLVSIFGSNLAAGIAQADSIPLSTSLGGVSVQFVNGGTTLNAPMLFVAGSQVNVQVPWNLVPAGATQNVNVIVNNNGVASAPSQVTVGPFSPGIFTAGPPDFRAIAQNVDGQLAQPPGSIPGLNTHPVKIGDALIIYATGLGAVDHPPADGGIPPSGLVNTLTQPIVTVGGISAQVLFSGLQPQFVGVNQVNIIIPANAPVGDKVPLQFQMGGITSPDTVTIAVSR